MAGQQTALYTIEELHNQVELNDSYLEESSAEKLQLIQLCSGKEDTDKECGTK